MYVLYMLLLLRFKFIEVVPVFTVDDDEAEDGQSDDDGYRGD